MGGDTLKLVGGCEVGIEVCWRKGRGFVKKVISALPIDGQGVGFEREYSAKQRAARMIQAKKKK